jgi:hypothetical protein
MRDPSAQGAWIGSWMKVRFMEISRSLSGKTDEADAAMQQSDRQPLL